MKLLSHGFSILLYLSMTLLAMGLILKNMIATKFGIAILISIPVCRALYSAVWFYNANHKRGMWFSLLVVVTLAVSIIFEL